MIAPGPVEGTDRGQIPLFPAVLDDYVGEDNPVLALDVSLWLDLPKLSFDGVAPLATGRPAIALAVARPRYHRVGKSQTLRSGESVAELKSNLIEFMIFALCGDDLASIATGHWTIEFHVVF